MSGRLSTATHSSQVAGTELADDAAVPLCKGKAVGRASCDAQRIDVTQALIFVARR